MKAGPTLVSFSVLSLAMFFWACSSFPEKPGRPFLSGSFDTVVATPNLIGPGDSLIWWYSLANQSGNGTLEWQIRPSPSPDYFYAGPDPAIPSQILFPIEAQIQNEANAGLRLPPLFVPGEYFHVFRFRSSDGAVSDSLKKKLFHYHPAYPELVLDTPLNGMLGSHILTRNRFKVQFRCFGNEVSDLRLEWFDSTKTQSLGMARQIPVSTLPNSRFNDSLDFPNRTGKQFYLKSTLQNAANRSITWWVPMVRKLN